MARWARIGDDDRAVNDGISAIRYVLMRKTMRETMPLWP